MSTENSTSNPSKKIISRVIIGIVIIAACIYGYKRVIFFLAHESTDNAQVEGHMTPILSRVGGYVKTVNVQDYQQVKVGDTIVTVDDDELQITLKQMEAEYQTALADLESAKASLKNTELTANLSKTNLSLNQIKANKASADYKRDQNLFKDQAITSKQVDDSKTNYDVTQKQIVASQEDVAISASRIPMMQAAVAKAQANVDFKKAKIDEEKLKLSYTTIVATASGKIGKKNIENGQYIQAGQPLMTIIDNNEFWVVANFKETQIEKIKVGQSAKITIDSYPDLSILGKVVSISEATGAKFSLLPPDNATGNFVKVTQRVPVKIQLNEPDKYREYLKSGLSLDVSVEVK
ncbi:HlyD family secretion protein [Solitalea sp. MAHUQ-68]|uniref:HlyD family secretion protein n=1 Tax=Solitalea agri TaxID=2953739 RepID=A0A9X2EZN2_9SPHI|nr:HlyD family secretion protein [Solitalea agri]MCO4291516.1 HlyD family secretion protein [Solitalea agri]